MITSWRWKCRKEGRQSGFLGSYRLAFLDLLKKPPQKKESSKGLLVRPQIKKKKLEQTQVFQYVSSVLINLVLCSTIHRRQHYKTTPTHLLSERTSHWQITKIHYNMNERTKQVAAPTNPSTFQNTKSPTHLKNRPCKKKRFNDLLG